MKRIASFSVDHRTIEPGLYISRVDDDITTFDMRFKKPNTGDLLTNEEMHSFEHMFATYTRNSCLSDSVIYFGPMGCQTGFYLLIRNVDTNNIKDFILEILNNIISHDERMPGDGEDECGNYRSLNVDSAKSIAREYLQILRNNTHNLKY